MGLASPTLAIDLCTVSYVEDEQARTKEASQGEKLN